MELSFRKTIFNFIKFLNLTAIFNNTLFKKLLLYFEISREVQLKIAGFDEETAKLAIMIINNDRAEIKNHNCKYRLL